MAKKKKNIIYSTNPDFAYSYDGKKEATTLQPEEQELRIWLERKGGGKTVSLIKDFVGAEDDLKALGSVLKNLCGVGGAAKNGEIMIQGDHRDKILEYLNKNGYGAKKAGG